MSIEVKLNKPDGLVDVKYYGTATLEERKQAVDKVGALYSHMRPLPILVNVRDFEIDLTMGLTIEEQEIFGKFLASHPKFTYARVAVLHKKGGNPNLFVHYFAPSDGYKLAQFSKRNEARDWLKEEV